MQDFPAQPDRKAAMSLDRSGAEVWGMVARVNTVAFQGIEGLPVDVQVMVAPGKLGMKILRWINF